MAVFLSQNFVEAALGIGLGVGYVCCPLSGVGLAVVMAAVCLSVCLLGFYLGSLVYCERDVLALGFELSTGVVNNLSILC